MFVVVSELLRLATEVAVEVDSVARLLFVVVSELLRFVTEVAVEVDSVANAVLVVNSWPPLTASVEPLLTTPGATLCSAMAAPTVSPVRVASSDRTPGVGVFGAPAAENWIGALLADAPISVLVWVRLTASVAATPAVTPRRIRVPPVPVKSTLVPPFPAATRIAAVEFACWTRPAVPALSAPMEFVLVVTLALVIVS